jgi:glycerol uptake facilitator-like aquaporin
MDIWLNCFHDDCFFGKISNAHFNPARTFGPALFSNDLDHLALYFIAPVIGSLIGAALIAQLRKSNS